MRRHNLLTNLDQRALAAYRSFHFERIHDWIETKSDVTGKSLLALSRERIELRPVLHRMR